ncbi:hypothetical protein [Plasticicumulans sp.]|uniref:hypothetical protein n=1 Tax=Plasticicumulans sp. TaxID=2307179 RepID=UPI0039326F32
MSLEDRDWYQKAIAERMRSQSKNSNSNLSRQRPDVDFPALFRQEQARRSAPVQSAASPSAWGSVLLAGVFVVVLVGLGVWAIKLVRVFS